jgi:hypothetical protein
MGHLPGFRKLSGHMPRKIGDLARGHPPFRKERGKGNAGTREMRGQTGLTPIFVIRNGERPVCPRFSLATPKRQKVVTRPCVPSLFHEKPRAANNNP